MKSVSLKPSDSIHQLQTVLSLHVSHNQRTESTV